MAIDADCAVTGELYRRCEVLGAAMKEGFRQSMAWLHTWSGLVVGWVLFFIFITGTVGYIEAEVTRWMQPERPMVNRQLLDSQQQFDAAYQWLQKNPQAHNAERWIISFKRAERGSDHLEVVWTDPPAEAGKRGQRQARMIDSQTAQALPEADKARKTGGGFRLYRMHYALHYIPYNISILIVGGCTMLMFVALISGVITHKKIFKDFFTFRPAKGQRSWLDAHNVISVIALPFYLMITYSGLVFFYASYMPLGMPLTYGAGRENTERFYAEFYPEFYNRAKPPKDAKAKPMASVAPNAQQLWQLYQQVEQQWGKDSVSRIIINSATQYQAVKVQFYPVNERQLLRHVNALSYEIKAGQPVPTAPTQQSKTRVFSEVVLGLHEGNFASALLRWLYVFSGLLGAAMIATGLVLWTVKRRPKQLKKGKISIGHHLVERLNVAMIVGLPLGISVYFWVNRLLPVSFPKRADWEVHSLFLCLLVVLIYSCFRPIAKAWYEGLALLALSWLCLPILNAITTDRHMLASFAYRDWALFSLDLGFILLGLLFAWISYAVWRKRAQIFKAQPKKTHPARAGINKPTADAE